jgi:hypothetical protein
MLSEMDGMGQSKSTRRKIGCNGSPSAEVGQGLLAELGGAGRAEQLSHCCRSKITLDGV